MFDVMWKHLTEVLLKSADKRSEVEQESVDHRAFYKTLTTSYVPSEQLLGKLSSHISQGNCYRFEDSPFLQIFCVYFPGNNIWVGSPDDYEADLRLTRQHWNTLLNLPRQNFVTFSC